jgi:hypothetical protein
MDYKRANIRITDNDGNKVTLYHFDGAPDRMGKRIELLMLSGVLGCCNACEIATYLVKGDLSHGKWLLENMGINLSKWCDVDKGYELAGDLDVSAQYLYTLDVRNGMAELRCCAGYVRLNEDDGRYDFCTTGLILEAKYDRYDQWREKSRVEYEEPRIKSDLLTKDMGDGRNELKF